MYRIMIASKFCITMSYVVLYNIKTFTSFSICIILSKFKFESVIDKRVTKLMNGCQLNIK